MNITILQPQWYDGIVATSLNREEITALILSKMYSAALDENNTVSFSGYLYSSTGSWEKAQSLMQLFNELTIDIPTSGRYIDFEDPLVELILLSKNLGDGVGVIQSDLYAINILDGSWFGGSNITSFNELQYFKPSAINQQGTFFNCNYLIEVTLPAGITYIVTLLFKSCDVLESVNNTQSITLVMNQGLAECPNLESLNLLSLTTVGLYAFAQDTNLLSIGNCAPTTIGGHAFENCSSLTSINLSNVTSIGDSAFNGCRGLTSVTIGNGVTSIGGYVFYNCSSLISVTINATTPPTLTGVNAFDNANNCRIYVPSQSVETYKSTSGWSSYTNRIQAIPTT